MTGKGRRPEPGLVLGVAMSNHDRAACLLRDGEIVSAVAEERLDRRKRSEGFYAGDPSGQVVPPFRAISYVLETGGVALDDVDLVACGRSTGPCREELLRSLPLPGSRMVEIPVPGHHLAHAYSAWATAPFEEAAVLVVDERGHGLPDGGFERCTWFEATPQGVDTLRRFRGDPERLSVGAFYNVFAGLLGLAEGGRPAAGKLMGLAGLGGARPEWPRLFELEDSGDAVVRLGALDDFFCGVPGLRVRPGYEGFEPRHIDGLRAKFAPIPWDEEPAADLARKAQDELEAAVLHTAAGLFRTSDARHLCYAGGVALNCLANRALRESGWDDVFVHPAATDDGTAVGLAYYGWTRAGGEARPCPTREFSPFTGRRYGPRRIDDAIASYGLADGARSGRPAETAARLAADGEIVCWFSGRSEWGPRALGARSIVADPRAEAVADRLNRSVKFREPYRPFGVSGTREGLAEVLGALPRRSALDPYMLVVGETRDPRLEGLRHVDGTVRYQLVTADFHPGWHRLIEAFGRRTGLPVVVNTSFNTLGEPLVETPEDAVRQFLLSGADVLVLEDRILTPEEVGEQTLARARSLAWQRSPVDPLRAAGRLVRSGHVGAAADVLRRFDATPDAVAGRGEEAVVEAHALHAVVAEAEGRPADALEHAEEVVRRARLPARTSGAADLLARHGDGFRRQAGRIAAALSSPGGVWRLLEAVAGGREDETPPDGRRTPEGRVS